MSQLAAPGTTGGTARLRARNIRVLPVLAPVVVGVVFLGVWQLAVAVWDIQPFVLPSPTGIASALAEARAPIWDASLHTGRNALLGLLIGAVLGVVAALVASLGRWLELMGSPVVMVASVIPIVALAPIFYTWFGYDVDTGRILVAAIASGIPVYVNTLRGLSMVAPVHAELMEVYNASPAQRALTVRLPTALPYVFTGLRIASSLAVISALIAEYFGGPVGGLGKSITTAVSGSNYPMAWAFVVGAIVLGLVFYVVALAVEVWSTRHQPTS